MRTGFAIREPGSGSSAAGLDLRALDPLGIKRLTTDSRRVKRGDTFIAYPGESQDGRSYIAQAIDNGAGSVLWERRGLEWKRAWRRPNLGIAHLRAHAGVIASHVYDHPSTRLWMIGVTGTNGKTTCSQWIARALNDCGVCTAVIGTLGYGFGTAAGAARRLPRVIGRNLVTSAAGVRFDVGTPWGAATVESPVIGRYNASNVLGLLAVLLASAIKLKDAVAAVARLDSVSGRLQQVGGGRRPLVVIDYAHTPDALEQVLLALRELMSSEFGVQSSELVRRGIAKRQSNSQFSTLNPRLICVFGCGGDRDRGKRPLMGRVATRLADCVVITSDNPRSENPLAIIGDILDGVRGIREKLAVAKDRRAAIRHAVADARRGDIVLIAGKGHETYQEVKGVKRPFSDIAVARAALRGWD